MKYIPLDAVLAEIEKRKNICQGVARANEDNKITHQYYNGKTEAYSEALVYINSLEVKEMSLEDAKKEELAQKYIDYTFKRHNIDANSKEGQLIYHAYMHGMNQCLNQLKTQNYDEVQDKDCAAVRERT